MTVIDATMEMMMARPPTDVQKVPAYNVVATLLLFRKSLHFAYYI